MYTINGLKFYSTPTTCGGCAAYIGYGATGCGRESQMGFCTLFEVRKNRYQPPPKRCMGIFQKAEAFPNGEDLCIVVT